MVTTSSSKLEIGDIGEMSSVSESRGMILRFSIGKVKVLEVNGDEVKFEVIEKLSTIVINGVEKSHFIPNTEVESKVYEYDTKTLTEIKHKSGAIKEKGQMLCGNKIGK